MNTRSSFFSPNATKIVSVADMQRMERDADRAGHSYATMMEIAGGHVAQSVLDLFVSKSHPALRTALILVGPGNNGGDGLVCARRLHDTGMPTRVYLWKRKTDPRHDDQRHFADILARGVEVVRSESDVDQNVLRDWLMSTGVVVDALLGTGANRPIVGLLADVLSAVRSWQTEDGERALVAVDCPSGLNCDSGALDPCTPSAAVTVTFAYAKQGHFLFPGAAAVGDLRVVDIGIPPELGEDIRTFVLTPDGVRSWLPHRDGNSHKGSFGKVLLVVGSRRYPGAAFLATSAAGRAGAGLVTGAVAETIWPVVAGMMPEATWLPLDTGSASEEGAIGGRAVETMVGAIPGYDAMVLGCGLGTAATTRRFVEMLLAYDMLPPMVIDADGLNILAQKSEWPCRLPEACVLTPHPAEMARLTGRSVPEVTGRRWSLAIDCAAAWKAVVLVKGPYTVVAAPDGRLAVLPVATPALATAGTGDVLAGLIGGLLAQGVEPYGAACLGAWLHGAAGLTCAHEFGPSGTLASDLLPRIPKVMNQLRTGD